MPPPHANLSSATSPAQPSSANLVSRAAVPLGEVRPPHVEIARSNTASPKTATNTDSKTGTDPNLGKTGGVTENGGKTANHFPPHCRAATNGGKSAIPSPPHRRAATNGAKTAIPFPPHRRAATNGVNGEGAPQVSSSAATKPPHLRRAMHKSKLCEPLLNKGGSAAGSNSPVGGFGNAVESKMFLTRRNITTISCDVCQKVRKLEHYSNRQIINYKNTIENVYAPKGRTVRIRVLCKDCTPGVVTQLHCIICDQTMELKRFTKTHRKTPDVARCKRCVEASLDTERFGEHIDHEELEDFSDEESSEEDVDDVDGYVSTPEQKASGQDNNDEDLVSALAKSTSRQSAMVTPLLSGQETPAGEELQWIPVDHAAKNQNYAFNYKVSSGANTPSRSRSGTSTATTPGTSGNASRGWGKVPKPPIVLAQEQVWQSERAKKLGLSSHGGQQRLFVRKQKRNDDDEEDDEDEE
ncbi:hypothetical protein BDZ91DRAFT_792100 [Kalaharituber pfeilii]|nr:hypothetical protein BDZ91DRAFT_792100 [Kalaharituber pfeilii]